LSFVDTLKVIYIAVSIVIAAVLYITLIYISLVFYVLAKTFYNLVCFAIRITFSKLSWSLKLEAIEMYTRSVTRIAWEVISIAKLVNLLRKTSIDQSNLVTAHDY
jgi:hypothetical protein